MTEKFVRSRYAVEVNPWSMPDEVEKATLCRGVIVAAWAQVDGHIAETLVRCWSVAAYQGVLPATYPNGHKARIALLRSLVPLPGPLARGQAVAEALLDEFATANELRTLMAHGRMRILPGWGAVFYDWRAAKGGFPLPRTQRITLADLEAEATRWSHFARRVHRAVATGGRRLKLPHPYA